MKPEYGRIRLYTREEWQAIVPWCLAYFIVFAVSARFLPFIGGIFPASVIALGMLYFAGPRLWPFVFGTSLLAGLAMNVPAPYLAILPITDTLTALAGTVLLRRAHFDPIFRHFRDIFMLEMSIVLLSALLPAAEALAHFLGHRGLPTPGNAYIATLFTYLIGAPFVLRWYAKQNFYRPPKEILETLGVFALLLTLNYVIFGAGIETILDIPVIYFLLVPFTWIALRLRPRFVTLALVLTAFCAIDGALLATSAAELPRVLFDAEVFLIVLASVFYIIVAIEEERRVNTNLMHSQVAMLKNAVDRISSESNAKNDFIAILAHELRNPLAPIVSSIELLRLKAIGDADDAATLAMMEDRLNTVRRLLDDMLDISRIAEGKVTLEYAMVDVSAIVERAILSTHHHRVERHQPIRVSLPDEALPVRGDPVRLEQIVSNLLTNASKYSNPSDGVEVIARRVGDEAEIVVKDQGIGIAPEVMETIFLPFHQVGQTDRIKKGLGIGLALVKSFVELHHGTIEAASEGTGHGSTFTIRLPLAE